MVGKTQGAKVGHSCIKGKDYMNYEQSRKWSDMYQPEMNQIAAGLILSDPKLISVYFKLPSAAEDQKLGIDMKIEVERIKISYRTRRAEHEKYWKEGFTIRNKARHGETELEKLQRDDYADFLLYALANPDNYGQVDRAVLIDLKGVGIQLKRYPHILENAQRGNGFVDFNYDAFPHSVIVGCWNCEEVRKALH